MPAPQNCRKFHCHPFLFFLLPILLLLLLHPISHQSLKMIYEYIVGGVVLATMLGFVLLYGVKGKKTTRVSMEITRNGFVKMLDNGTRQSASEITRSTDVVIVGAGVAGAALAYTLGKVIRYFYFLCILAFSFLVKRRETHNSF